MRFTVYTHEHLIKRPAQTGIGPMMNPSLADLGGEHRTKPVPPKPHCLMADVDTPFEQNVFDLAQ
jgi:hypothetical protein